MDIFVELVGGGFVKNDGVVGLVLDCRPGALSVQCSRRVTIGVPGHGEAEGVGGGC